MRAKVAGAAGNFNPFDGVTANLARFAFAFVDIGHFQIRAHFAVALAVVLAAGAAVFQGFFKDGGNRGKERGNFGWL